MTGLTCVEFVLEIAFSTTIQSKPVESTFYLGGKNIKIKYQVEHLPCISLAEMFLHFKIISKIETFVFESNAPGQSKR